MERLGVRSGAVGKSAEHQAQGRGGTAIIQYDGFDFYEGHPLASGAMREVEGGALSDEGGFPRGNLPSRDFGENAAPFL